MTLREVASCTTKTIKFCYSMGSKAQLQCTSNELKSGSDIHIPTTGSLLNDAANSFSFSKKYTAGLLFIDALCRYFCVSTVYLYDLCSRIRIQNLIISICFLSRNNSGFANRLFIDSNHIICSGKQVVTWKTSIHMKISWLAGNCLQNLLSDWYLFII